MVSAMNCEMGTAAPWTVSNVLGCVPLREDEAAARLEGNDRLDVLVLDRRQPAGTAEMIAYWRKCRSPRITRKSIPKIIEQRNHVRAPSSDR